eukprot:IDg1896t1
MIASLSLESGHCTHPRSRKRLWGSLLSSLMHIKVNLARSPERPEGVHLWCANIPPLFLCPSNQGQASSISHFIPVAMSCIPIATMHTRPVQCCLMCASISIMSIAEADGDTYMPTCATPQLPLSNTETGSLRRVIDGFRRICDCLHCFRVFASFSCWIVAGFRSISAFPPLQPYPSRTVVPWSFYGALPSVLPFVSTFERRLVTQSAHDCCDLRAVRSIDNQLQYAFPHKVKAEDRSSRHDGSQFLFHNISPALSCISEVDGDMFRYLFVRLCGTASGWFTRECL